MHIWSLALAAALQPTTALACGGFFCDNEARVDQSGEKIVFAIDEVEEQIEVHVQIAYEGPAEDFAWVLPAPALPELFLSTELLFSTLEWSTAPDYRLEYLEEGDCEQDFRIRAAGDTACWNCEFDMADADDGGGGVVVVATQRVGPYESVTLQADSADEVLSWLGDRDFDLPNDLGDALDPYLAAGGYLVALRLAKDADTGDLAPLGMRYAGAKPVIPIQLTRIAATPDMRLQPYVLSSGRAVPDNYMHVVVNEAAIDWFSDGSNYRDVVTRAANEAGGQAFATDFAGSTSELADLLYTPGQFDGLTDRLSQSADLQSFMDHIASAGFSGTSQLLAILSDCITVPTDLAAQGVQARDILNCPDCYGDSDLGFVAETCSASLDARLIQPVIEADALFDRHAWITRLTSSISPAEMTLDPTFVINSEMDAVLRTRIAQLYFECDGGAAYDAPRRLELPGGATVPLPSARWFDDNDVTYLDWVEKAAVFAALEVQQTSADQPPETIATNAEAIASALLELAGDDEPGGPEVGGTEPPTTEGCGCSGAAGAGLGVPLLALLGLRRRRQAPTPQRAST